MRPVGLRVGWDWMRLQLDNGSALMAVRLERQFGGLPIGGEGFVVLVGYETP